MNGAEGVSSARCHPYPSLCLAAYLLLDAFRDIDKQPWRRCGSPYSIRGTNGIGCGAWQPFSCAVLLRGEEIDKDVLAEKRKVGQKPRAWACICKGCPFSGLPA